MDYALWFCVFAILGYSCFYFIRQRIKRRRQAQGDIPAFLRKDGANAGDSSLGDTKVEWTEVYPCPKRRDPRPPSP